MELDVKTQPTIVDPLWHLVGTAEINPHTNYTPNETAAIMRCTVKTLANKRCKKKGIPFIKGDGKQGRILYRGVDIIREIAQRMRHSTSDPGPPKVN